MTSNHVISGLETTLHFFIQKQMHRHENKMLKLKTVHILMEIYDVFQEFCQQAEFLVEQMFCRTDSLGAPDSFRMVKQRDDSYTEGITDNTLTIIL